MNRRSFFKKAAFGAAVVAAAPALLSEPFMPKPVIAATIGEYYDYANFSSLALDESCREMVENCAVELGYRAGQSISELYSATFDESGYRFFGASSGAQA